MSSVGELRQELQRECLSRQRQEELNAKLQDEYDHLLKKLAVAELHIDRLRLGSSVDASKRFTTAHDVEQHAISKEQLQTQSDPSTRAHHGSDHANEVRVINTELCEDGTDSDEPQEVKVSVNSHSGGPDSQVPLDNASSIHSADGTEDFLKMSDTSIASWASVESTQMAHFFQAHNLQEQIKALKERINSGGVSVSEIMVSLRKTQEEHQKLVEDIASSSTDLDALNRRYGGRASRHIAHSQEAVGNELSGLAKQLKELEELLRTKTQEFLRSSPPTTTTHVPPSPSARRSDTSTSDSEGLADDSLDSPNLPLKYIYTHEETHFPLATSPSRPPTISSEPSALNITPSAAARCEGMETQNTLSEFSDNIFSGDLSGQSSQLLHHRSSAPSGDGSGSTRSTPHVPSGDGSGSNRSTHGDTRGRMHTDAENSANNSLLVENEVTSPSPSKQLLSTNPTVKSSHPPVAHSPPPPPLPAVPHLQTTLSENNTGIRDIHLPPQSPPYHYPHLDPTHLKAPPTSSHYTNSDGPSPLLRDFESVRYPSHRSPSEWGSPGEADSGFAGSELPQRKPDSTYPPTVASSYQSVAESAEEEERGGEEDEEDCLPSLTSAAIDALRTELEDLKHQILNSPRLPSSVLSTPYQHSKHTGTPCSHSRRGTHKEPLVSMTTTTALQTEWRHRNHRTLQIPFSDRTAPSTPNEATGTFAGSSITWQSPIRSSHHGTRANHLLHSATSSSPLALGRRFSTPMPSLHMPSTIGRVNLEEDETQKPSLGRTTTNSKTSTCSSAYGSHSTERGHDHWVCSTCGGGGAHGNDGGVTSHLQGQKHGSKRKRDAQVTFVREERGEIVEHKRYRMSGQKVPPYRTQHFPPSSDSDGDSDVESHHLGAEEYQPTSSRIVRASRFQPSVLLGQRPVTTSAPSILRPSVLLSQQPVATSTPANLNKHRFTHYHDHFSPSIRPTEPYLSRRRNISGATPRRKWSSFRERVSRGRYSDVRHIVVPTEHESSSDDDQGAGRTSPGQYYVLKKPKREDYHTGSVATRTPKSNQFKLLHNSSTPVQEEVYFSEPAVFGLEGRRSGVMVMTPRPVEGVYLVEGGHGSVSEVKAIEATPLDLGDACRLARQLNRRSNRVHRTLQMELNSLY